MNVTGIILIIDDEIDICQQLAGLLNDRGFNTKFYTSSEQGIEAFKRSTYSLVILDIWLNNSKFDGFQALEKIKELNENVPVLMISGHGNIETAVNSIKKGAYDFIEKPLDGEIVIFKVRKALENYNLKNKINNLSNSKNSNFIANSNSSKKVLNLLKKISRTESSVILSGPKGSGKEFLGRKIHLSSNRKNKIFTVYNFSNYTNKNSENEIFGNEQDKSQKVFGILDEVNGGTLLLKNIEKMNSKIQGKLLRVIEEKKFYRVGSFSPKNIDFRLIGSSILSLSDILKKKILRTDLLKKINFFEINVPGLDERSQDIEDLVKEFLKDSLNYYEIDIKNISKDIYLFFNELSCIKNIAQLKKFIEWSIFMFSDENCKLLNRNNFITLLKSFLGNQYENESLDFLNFNLKDAREIFEKKYLGYNLNKFNNNITKMSKEIGMERTALYRKLKLLNIKQ